MINAGVGEPNENSDDDESDDNCNERHIRLPFSGWRATRFSSREQGEMTPPAAPMKRRNRSGSPLLPAEAGVPAAPGRALLVCDFARCKMRCALEDPVQVA